LFHAADVWLLRSPILPVCKTVAEAADKAYDYVIVATKAVPDVITTPAILSPLLDSCYPYSQPIYVLIQNGLNVEVDLYRALEHLGKGKPRIVSTAVFVAANLLEPNVVKHGAFVSFKNVINFLQAEPLTRIGLPWVGIDIIFTSQSRTPPKKTLG